YTELFCNYILIYFFFFFSSRRRHTRSKRDWSSDVCSSDLNDETREYVKESSSKVMDSATFYTTNPDIAINKVKRTVTTVNQMITSNTDSAMNVLDQVEDSLQKFLK